MPGINGESSDGAKTIGETSLPQPDTRTEVLGFLAESIDYAYRVSNSNHREVGTQRDLTRYCLITKQR